MRTYPLQLCALLCLSSLAVACGKDTRKKPAPQPAPKTSVPKTSPPKTSVRKRPSSHTLKPWGKVDYRVGHALTPKASLLAWLKKNAKRNGRRTLFKLPVVITAKEGFTLGRKRSFVGASTTDPGTDKLLLDLDDGALGISLNGYLGMRCGKSAKTCALWLEGHWGALLQRGPRLPPSPTKAEKRYPFAVRNVGEIIKDKNAQAMIAK